MNPIKFVSKIMLVAALVCVTATSALAVNVQVFQPTEEGQSVSEIRDKALELAFAQAILSEALRMVPGEIEAARAEVLKSWLGEHRDVFVTGYRDKTVTQEENGVSVGLNVDVNRQVLREYLKKIGLFSTFSKKIKAAVSVTLGKGQQDDLAALDKLMLLYGVEKVDAGAAVNVVINSTGQKSWNGSLSVLQGQNWKAYGLDIETVWSKLWENYFKSVQSSADMNPRASIVVSGWFSPEGAREFDRVLKSWDAAVQEVKLVGLEMKPTTVSAKWTLEIADQWLLKSYLNDYLPQRGLSYTINGIENK